MSLVCVQSYATIRDWWNLKDDVSEKMGGTDSTNGVSYHDPMTHPVDELLSCL